MQIRAEVRESKDGKWYRAVVIENGEKQRVVGFSSSIMTYCHLFNARFSDVCRELEDGRDYIFYEV